MMTKSLIYLLVVMSLSLCGDGDDDWLSIKQLKCHILRYYVYAKLLIAIDQYTVGFV